MTETYVAVEQPTAPENPTLKVRNVSTVVGSNTVLHQVTMSAKEDGTIIPPASETKQDTGNASLASIDSKTPALGQALASGSVPSVLPQSQIDALTPPAAITGFATSALQGALTETAPATDTASSGQNGRLQRIAQRITSLIGLLPTSLGQKAMSASLPVVIASDQATFPVTATLAGTIKTSLSASSAVTIDLASLASDTNLLAGRESTAIDNTTTRALDYLLTGKIRQGTTPTTGKEIRVYVVGTLTEAPTWPDVFDGTNSAETVTSAGIRDSVCRLAAVMATDSTSDRDNYFGPVSVAALFGGVLPAQFVVFVTHNTAVNLNSTAGNHVLSITPVFQTIS